MANLEEDKHYILGVFGDEEILMPGVEKIRHKGVRIYEVFTPYPVHGLEHKLGYAPSYMPKAAFLFGALGTSLAILMQVSMIGIDWPMIIGGKPYIAVPDFIPITFEMTVLLSAFGMVGTFMISQGLKPHKVPRIFDRRSTDDKHIVAIDLSKNKLSEAEIAEILKDAGAEESYRKNFTDEENEGSFLKYLADLFTHGVTSSSRALKK